MWRFGLCASLAIGCGGGQASTEQVEISSAEKIDLNGDGTPDVFKYFGRVDGNLVLLRKEIDLNIDGKIDVWRYYDASGSKTRDEMDMDFDGKVDSKTFYEKGVVVRKEIDLAFDQTPDQVKYYRDGKISRVEWDTNSDGKVDYWEFYKGGKLTKKGIDADGDGQPDPDKWTEIEGESHDRTLSGLEGPAPRSNRPLTLGYKTCSKRIHSGPTQISPCSHDALIWKKGRDTHVQGHYRAAQRRPEKTSG